MTLLSVSNGISIKPLDQYSEVAAYDTIGKKLTGESIWRIRIPELNKVETCVLDVQTDAQILSQIKIFGSSRKELHTFKSSTTFHLGTIGNEILIEIANIIGMENY